MRIFGAGLINAAVGPIKKMIRRRTANLEKIIPELSPFEASLIQQYQEFTMTSVERQWALISAAQYLNGAKIEGEFVECGVWRGGNMMMAKELCRQAGIDRTFYLFDTFAGMSEPSAEDVSHSNTSAIAEYQTRRREGHVDWDYAPLEDVKRNFERSRLLDDKVIFVTGKVEDTLRDRANIPERIALLRLDTDWYESTKIELEVLYPRLVSGGVLIIDDYGHWRGARKAVDEYFVHKNVLMNRIDYTARLIIKH